MDRSNTKFSQFYQIADLRENISVLSDVLTATKSSLEDIKLSIERFKLPLDTNEDDGSMDDIIKDLYERFGNRNNVFAVSGTFFWF